MWELNFCMRDTPPRDSVKQQNISHQGCAARTASAMTQRLACSKIDVQQRRSESDVSELPILVAAVCVHGGRNAAVSSTDAVHSSDA